MQEDKVFWYGIWFCGNDVEGSSLCYDGREIYLTRSAQEALDMKKNFEENNPEVTYKLVKIMEVEDAE